MKKRKTNNNIAMYCHRGIIQKPHGKFWISESALSLSVPEIYHVVYKKLENDYLIIFEDIFITKSHFETTIALTIGLAAIKIGPSQFSGI